MNKHAYIALRFVPQSEYEKAASLEITPSPGVVTRVFMLFRGIKDSALPGWANALGRAEEDVGFWLSVVGIDRAKMEDKATFRVLEWGDMEVFV